jgi:hypothetical protein
MVEVVSEGWDSLPQMQRCSKCGLSKSADQFTRDRQKSDGLRSSCRECNNSTPCAVPGCGKPAKSRGCCAMHALALAGAWQPALGAPEAARDATRTQVLPRLWPGEAARSILTLQFNL